MRISFELKSSIPRGYVDNFEVGGGLGIEYFWYVQHRSRLFRPFFEEERNLPSFRNQLSEAKKYR